MPVSVKPPVIAHRGACHLAPENTLAAFRAATSTGVKWIEFDVMLAKDGEPVVIHDVTVDRTTNGSGFVAALASKDLLQLDAGSWFAPEFAGERIPHLVDVLGLLSEIGLAANIEIKCSVPANAEETGARVAAELRKWLPELGASIMVSSFSLPVLQAVRRELVVVPLGLALHNPGEGWQEACAGLDCASLHINHQALCAENIKKYKQGGRLVFAYTVNTPARAAELYEIGVDAIFSDCPEKILSALFPETIC